MKRGLILLALLPFPALAAPTAQDRLNDQAAQQALDDMSAQKKMQESAARLAGGKPVNLFAERLYWTLAKASAMKAKDVAGPLMAVDDALAAPWDKSRREAAEKALLRAGKAAAALGDSPRARWLSESVAKLRAALPKGPKRWGSGAGRESLAPFAGGRRRTVRPSERLSPCASPSNLTESRRI